MPSICVCVCVGIVNTMQVHTVTRNSLSSQVRWSARARARASRALEQIFTPPFCTRRRATRKYCVNIYTCLQCARTLTTPLLRRSARLARAIVFGTFWLVADGSEGDVQCSGREIENPDATGKSHSPHISPVLGIICVQSNYNLCVCVCACNVRRSRATGMNEGGEVMRTEASTHRGKHSPVRHDYATSQRISERPRVFAAIAGRRWETR